MSILLLWTVNQMNLIWIDHNINLSYSKTRERIIPMMFLLANMFYFCRV